MPLSGPVRFPAILKKRTNGSRAEYLIKWMGYPQSEATWEPLTNLAASMDLVRNFEANSGHKLTVAKKCAQNLAAKEERKEPRRLRKVGDCLPMEPPALPTEAVASPPTVGKEVVAKAEVAELNVEYWHEEAERVKPGSFSRNTVQRVLQSFRDTNDHLVFEVQWDAKGPVPVGNSLVTLDELREKDSKALVDYLVQFV